jgi:hypothetical protein
VNANIKSFLFPEKMSHRKRTESYQDVLNFLGT